MAQRQRISDLIDAGFGRDDIINVVMCSRATFYRVWRAKKKGLPIVGGSGDRGGQRRIVSTPSSCRRLRDAFRRQPRRSLRQHARHFGVNERTVRRMAKNIGAVSRIRIRRPLLTQAMRDNRLKLAKKMLNNMKSSAPGRIIFFSDEKNFNVREAYNRRNSRYIAVDGDPINYSAKYATSTKNPAAIMMLGAVASTGEVSPPIWFKPRETMNAERYVKELKQKLVPWMFKVAADHPVAPGAGPAPFVFQQDGAPPHTARITQAFLMEKLGKSGFWKKEMWPANSPDLNPLDYSIWNAVASKACFKPHSSVQTLKSSVTRVWNNLDAAYVSHTCKKFRARLEKVIHSQGSTIE